MGVPYFKVNEEGLLHFFGPLEANIMDVIWSSTSDRVTIKEVQEKIASEHEISFNTVMTVMNRLVEKGHLLKTPHPNNKKITYFHAVFTKDEFIHKQTGSVTQMLFKDFEDHTVTHMIDALNDVDYELLKKLEKKLAEIKNRREP